MFLKGPTWSWIPLLDTVEKLLIPMPGGEGMI